MIQRWTPEDDALLVRCVQGAATPREGCKVAAKALGRTVKACLRRLDRIPLDALRRKLSVAAAEKGRLTKEDIEKIAAECGCHYHVALSTLGGLHKAGVMPEPACGCSAKIAELENELRRRDSELAELREKLRYYESECVTLTREQAELLPTTGYLLALYERIAELERQVEAGRRLFAASAGVRTKAARAQSRVAELEKMLGAGVNPLKTEFGNELSAAFGACLLKLNHEGWHPIADSDEYALLKRVAESAKLAARSLAAALAEPERADRHLDRARQAFALLGACLAWVEDWAKKQQAQPAQPA